jgi:hypothetical protein
VIRQPRTIEITACRCASGAGQWRGYRRVPAAPHRVGPAGPHVRDPATLLVAFDRVAGNKGANTPGVDGVTAAWVEEQAGTASGRSSINHTPHQAHVCVRSPLSRPQLQHGWPVFEVELVAINPPARQ